MQDKKRLPRDEEAQPLMQAQQTATAPASSYARYAAPFVMEFIGTFFLVLTVGATSVMASPLQPLAIGAILLSMVFLGGHICGAHYNPAITLAVWLTGRKKISHLYAALYIITQLSASVAAACTYWALSDRTFAPQPGEEFTKWKALGAEICYTFALASVMMNVATTRSQQQNSFFGLAIGFTVLAGVIAVGPISGGVFNPAVATGPMLIHAAHLRSASHLKYLWIYWLGPCLGAALAAMAFRITNFMEYIEGEIGGRTYFSDDTTDSREGTINAERKLLSM